MRWNRTRAATIVLVVQVVLAAVGLVFHYVFTAEYGDITRSTAETVRGLVLTPGLLHLVALLGVVVLVLAQRWGLRMAAVALPVLMILGLALLTPLALDQKLEQYTSTPRCLVDDDGGPGARAAAQSQATFDSIQHVGHFGGGGGVGVNGCDRGFLLTEDVDVLQHYRTALADAGWTVVEDDAEHVRAERDGMAFEVVTCTDGGVVWAGSSEADGGASCGLQHDTRAG